MIDRGLESRTRLYKGKTGLAGGGALVRWFVIFILSIEPPRLSNAEQAHLTRGQMD